jgi:hypothetical protein
LRLERSSRGELKFLNGGDKLRPSPIALRVVVLAVLTPRFFLSVFVNTTAT